MSFFYQNSKEQLRLFTSRNNTFATHLHGQVELILALSGRLSVTADGVRHDLHSGQGVLIFPNRLHSLCTDAGSESTILLTIFRPDFCPRYRKYFQDYAAADSSFDVEELSPHSRTAAAGLLALTGEFERGGTIPLHVSRLAEGYLSLLLADLFLSESPLRLRLREPGNSLEPEQRILIWLEEHYTEDLSLELVASEFGVSRFKLSRLFADGLHTSFPSYVNSKRLEYARELLSDTDRSVTAIALDAGFGSSRSFFREFKQAFHMTPNAYRRQHITQAPPP
ncbi:MAG: AraC family transcriptional regulator [Clostridium sp.]|nr:AraC family transcriptional regulator [Acetatifactor muris]MCM1526836.1 AraC family transcriptional regulator [Bacteroides sp.]MCM1562964.1 AraC family transcriptional regulator [Clostridium sp.]